MSPQLFDNSRPTLSTRMAGAGVGEKVEEVVVGYHEAVQDAKLCYHTMGISLKSDE
jgi:hypothetical protein